MKDSQDLLTDYNLLTGKCRIERFAGGSIINFGWISREEHPEIFRRLESIFEIKPKLNKVYLSINNTEYFDFFDMDDNVNLLHDDAPKLCYSNFTKNGSVPLSRQDAITLARFIIKKQQEIIEETKDIIEELERIEKEL